MKKKFALRAMALVLTLVFAVSAFTVFSSAATVDNRFTFNETNYTSSSDTVGYTYAFFDGMLNSNSILRSY